MVESTYNWCWLVDSLMSAGYKVHLAKDLRPEYNFDYSKAVRGKYFKRLLEEEANVVVLEPDVAKTFGNSAAVNDALRSLLDLTRATQRLTRRSGGRSKTRAA